MLLELNLDTCRQRQRALATLLSNEGMDQIVLVRPENVQYLTGFRPHRLMSAAVTLTQAGHCLLIAPNDIPEHAAVDDIVTYSCQKHSTLRQDQVNAMMEKLFEVTGPWPSSFRIGVEHSQSVPLLLQPTGARQFQNVEPYLWQLRRKKDPDELALIRQAIACTDAMYARAREIIRPGICELDVFSELFTAAVKTAGEILTEPLGNDFQCNSPGGMPRNRLAQSGELYILDLGPCVGGYYADNCRTFAVDGEPTTLQQKAWKEIVEVLTMVEESVRPGVACREIFAKANEQLNSLNLGEFHHHLGHGIGLYPHETPHLNPHWNDVFMEGDVFTAEPGLYGPDLKAGIRLEQDYLVTATGVERLTHFPLDL